MKESIGHNFEKRNTDRKLVLVGNPNVGKSVLFQHLTGCYVTVSNYPGTTVDITIGIGNFAGKRYQVFDTPGTHSLSPKSEDEKVTRDVLYTQKPDCVIQVADSKNLRRTLDLTLQLIELEMPVILALNMSDEAKERGIQVDSKKLSELLGISAVETVAVTGRGITSVQKLIPEVKKSNWSFQYDPEIERAIAAITSLFPCTIPAKRGVALMLLSQDKTVKTLFPNVFTPITLSKIDSIISDLQNQYAKPLSLIIAEQRQDQVETLATVVLQISSSLKMSLQEKINHFTLHPVFGVLIAFFILYAMYKFVGQFAAGTLVDFFENILFGKYINPFLAKGIHAFIPSTFIQDLLVGEYGLFTMALTYAFALILPIVTAFFLFFGILEDTGYLPRLAVMMDRMFRAMGLNGKAVLPMVLGLGCDTMATLTTRILETKKERIITTLLLTLAIPCSAQLGVILGMLGGLSGKATIIWLGVLTITILIVGFLASRLLPGDKSNFILEIPPIRIPKLSNLIIKTIARLEWYLKEAVPLFIIATLALFLLDRTGILKTIEQLSAPLVVNLLGLPAEAARAFLIGFLRRDYGAAGLYTLAQKGLMNPTQIVVSLVTITLFVPCVAQFLVTIKERGWKTAVAISVFVLFFAFASGGLLNYILHYSGIQL